MNQLDLNATFTKVNLWKQLQFRKILYVDADVVSLRAPDELFDLDPDLAVCLKDFNGKPHSADHMRIQAAPDIGWPDCFNSVCLLSSLQTSIVS